MQEVKLVFEREGIEGIVPVGAYLSDSAKRLGVRAADCDITGDEHDCAFEITEGMELLSKISPAETARLKAADANGHTRLACFAVIEQSGEITIMTSRKKEEKKPDAPVTAEEFKKSFTEMPLQEKLSKLVELEAIALTDTLSFVLNSPYTVADKLMGVMADFGLKKEADQKQASRPPEDAPDPGKGDDTKTKTKSPEANKGQATDKGGGDKA
jgi:ferredoxin